jgi:hypothetical protein
MSKEKLPTLEERKIEYLEAGKGAIYGRQNTFWAVEIAGKCDHDWQPVSFRFENQALDQNGRVQIRQPDLTDGRVYCVCMKCLSHTYVNTGFIGYILSSPDELERYPEED